MRRGAAWLAAHDIGQKAKVVRGPDAPFIRRIQDDATVGHAPTILGALTRDEKVVDAPGAVEPRQPLGVGVLRRPGKSRLALAAVALRAIERVLVERALSDEAVPPGEEPDLVALRHGVEVAAEDVQ